MCDELFHVIRKLLVITYKIKDRKAIPVLNEVPCHEDVLGSGGIALGILNLTTCR